MNALKGRGLSKFAGLATMVLFSGCVTEQAAPGTNAVTLTRNGRRSKLYRRGKRESLCTQRCWR